MGDNSEITKQVVLFIDESDFTNPDFALFFKWIKDKAEPLYMGVSFNLLREYSDGTALITMELYPSKTMLEEKLSELTLLDD